MDKGGQEKEGEEPEGGRGPLPISTSQTREEETTGSENRVEEVSRCCSSPQNLNIVNLALAQGGGIRPHTEKSKFFAGLSDFFHIYIWKRVH